MNLLVILSLPYTIHMLPVICSTNPWYQQASNATSAALHYITLFSQLEPIVHFYSILVLQYQVITQTN